MQLLGKPVNHKSIYYYLLILTVICLPVSRFALSISMILLISNYVFDFNYKKKAKLLLADKSILIFVGIFIIHILFFLNTTNFEYAFHDLGNKAILLLYPVIIGTSDKLSYKQIQNIIKWFVISLFVSTIISVVIFLGYTSVEVNDIRDISQFMSHIRLSLLVNMGIFSMLYFLFSPRTSMSRVNKYIYMALTIWFIGFLLILKSLTGLVVFSLTMFVSMIYVLVRFKNKNLKYIITLVLFMGVSAVGVTVYNSISNFYFVEKIDWQNLDKETCLGNLYKHDKANKQIENGNYVWIYICDKELEKEWNKHSEYNYGSKDDKNQNLRVTLLRYMTSKGFRKDSLGFSKLDEQDIRNIESGMANCIFENRYSLKPILYQVIWQVDVYSKGHNPAGNSITERLEFLKAAKGIIKENIFFGVGTGDVKDAFLNQYKKIDSKLPVERRLRAHNQYVTFLITFGIFGFLAIMACLFYPLIKKGAFKNYLVLMLLLIVLLSFINEDTLETQIGITFFSYFYSLFIFGSKLFLKEEGKYV